MTRKIKDLTGFQFNYYTVMSLDNDNIKRDIRWIVKCRCGTVKSIRGADLKNGHSKSCGCYKIEKVISDNTVHNLTHNPFYRSWHSVKQRCTNSKNKLWHRYGGRGIKLFDAWVDDPKAFIEYVSNLDNARKDGMSIDRIDNDGNYEPGNIKWSNKQEQGRNTSFVKINMDVANCIRENKKDGMKIKNIAANHNISISIVKNVLYGNSWKND
jgi:hypothetical protein